MMLPSKYTLLEFDCLESTNSYAKELAKKGSNENTVIIADKQTAGRGQVGRTFFSPEATGLYFSIILRPEFSLDFFPFITTAAAVAVSRAIEKVTKKQTGIKWVNDIYINGKKVSGILTETSTDIFSNRFAILGIGINLTKPVNDFPNDIKETAASLFEKVDNLKKLKENLLKEILENFSEFYNDLPNKSFLAEYREKSILIDKNITFEYNGTNLSGKATYIDDNANLIVECANQTIILSSGKATVRLNEK